MVSDTLARNAVRQLMKRFDLIQAQHLGLAYVLAKRDAAEYARLLDAVEEVIPTVIQPAAEADALRSQVYEARIIQMQIGARQCSLCLARDQSNTPGKRRSRPCDLPEKADIRFANLPSTWTQAKSGLELLGSSLS
jgi:hypothetical protein